jgi:hypothetical protein
MRRKWIVVVVTAGIMGARLCGATQPEISDEVLVHGTRLKELRTAIAEAEDRFYVRYNELNMVDAYDIECGMDAHTGTKLKQRRCFTRLQLEAKAQNAREVIAMFQEQDRDPADGVIKKPGRPPNTDPQAVWLARFDDYRDNMLYLLKMNPDLRRLARERERAEERYDAEYKRRLKGRLVHIE